MKLNWKKGIRKTAFFCLMLFVASFAMNFLYDLAGRSMWFLIISFVTAAVGLIVVQSIDEV